jgi:cytochrome c
MIRQSLLPFALLAGAGLAAPAMAQDAAAGAAAFQAQCGVCHSADKPAKNKIGPSLLGVMGRKAGTAPGANYSAAMKAYGQVWTTANLDAFLAAPSKTVPGTNMTVAGVKDPAKRANLIAYLKTRK